MKTTIANNEFKQLRETTEKRNGSIVVHSVMIASFQYEYNSRFFSCSRGVLLSEASVKYVPKNVNRNYRGISSCETDLKAFVFLMVLHTFVSKTPSDDKKSEAFERVFLLFSK
jgi:hypothetical protein